MIALRSSFLGQKDVDVKRNCTESRHFSRFVLEFKERLVTGNSIVTYDHFAESLHLNSNLKVLQL